MSARDRRLRQAAAERDRQDTGIDLSQLSQIGTIFGAFLLGAITVEFIAGSGSGGVDVGGIGLMILTLL